MCKKKHKFHLRVFFIKISFAGVISMEINKVFIVFSPSSNQNQYKPRYISRKLKKKPFLAFGIKMTRPKFRS